MVSSPRVPALWALYILSLTVVVDVCNGVPSTLSTLSCVGQSSGTVNVAVGETVVCTITSDDTGVAGDFVQPTTVSGTATPPTFSAITGSGTTFSFTFAFTDGGTLIITGRLAAGPVDFASSAPQLRSWASPPSASPLAISWTDGDGALGTVGGSVTVTPAGDESSFTEYACYWSGDGAAILASSSAPLGTVATSGGTVLIAIGTGLTPPTGANFILVRSRNPIGSLAPGLSAPVSDAFVTMSLSETSMTVPANSGEHTIEDTLSYTASGTTPTGVRVTPNNAALVTGSPSGILAGNITFTTSQQDGVLELEVAVTFGSGETAPQTITVTITPYPSPAILSFSPAVGPGCGYTQLTITGTGFGVGSQDITGVTIGTSACTPLTYISDSQVTCRVNDQVSTGIVALTTFKGTASSAGNFVVDTKTREKVDHVVPAFAPSKKTTLVTITGQHMRNTFTGISIGGTNCTAISYKTENLITCKTVAPGKYIAGSVQLLRVSGPQNCAPLPGPTFTFTGPRINLFEPKQAPTYGFRTVTVRGSYFGKEKIDIVRFDIAGVPCLSSLQFLDSTTIRCTPSNITGPVTGPIVVETFDGGVGTSTETFTFFDSNAVNPANRPRIESVTPAEVSYLGGESVTIAGVNLGKDPDDVVALLVDGTRWENDCVWVSSVKLICVTRPGTVGTKSVSLETKSGSRALTEGTLTYTFVGAISLTHEAPLVTDEDGTLTVKVTAVINQQPRFNVRVRVFSNDTTEGVVSLRELFFPRTTWDAPLDFDVTGVKDEIRDGDTAYDVYIQVESDDTVFEGLYVPPLAFTNLESFPILDSVSPAAVPFSGRVLTLFGRNFDTEGMSVVMEGNVIDGSAEDFRVITRNRTIDVPVTGPQLRRLLQTETEEVIIAEATGVQFRAPSFTGGSESYRPVTLVARDGKNVTSTDLIFYTDNCPDPGQYGTGSQCSDCPTGGICKGGLRIWPRAGYWNSGEDSPGVEVCDPPIRCLGCEAANSAADCYNPDAPCSKGYEGRLCGQCADGFYETNAVCETCPSAGDLIFLTMVNFGIWVTVAVAGAVIEDRENFSHMLGFVVAVQEVAAVGQMLNAQLPVWLRGVYENLYLFAGDISFLKPECLGSLTPDIEYALSIAYNIALGLPLIAFVPLMKKISHKLNAKKSQFYRDNREQHYNNRATRVYMIHARLVYFAVLQKCIETMSCEKKLGKWSLVTNPGVECFQGAHIGLYVLSLLILIIFGIGYPAWYFRKIYQNENKLYTDNDYMEKYDFIYDPYIKRFKYLWMLELFFQVMVAIGATSLSTSPNAQFALLATAFGTNIFLMLTFRPMRRGWENYVIAAFNVANFTAMLIIWLSGQNKLSDTALNMMIYALVALLLYGIGALAFVMFYYILWVWQPRSLYHTRRAKKEAQEFEDDLEEEMALIGQFLDATPNNGGLQTDALAILADYQDATSKRHRKRAKDKDSESGGEDDSREGDEESYDESDGDVDGKTGGEHGPRDMESMAIRLMFAGAEGDPKGTVENLPKSSSLKELEPEEFDYGLSRAQSAIAALSTSFGNAFGNGEDSEEVMSDDETRRSDRDDDRDRYDDDIEQGYEYRDDTGYDEERALQRRESSMVTMELGETDPVNVADDTTGHSDPIDPMTEDRTLDDRSW